MNLIGPMGHREVLSWKEAAEKLSVKVCWLRRQVRVHKLVKRYSGSFPFYYRDVSDFLVKLNNGALAKKKPGRGKK